MVSYNEFEDSELDFDSSEQDKVINQMIFDSDFLDKCLRVNLTKDLFVGDIRQIIVEYIYEYYDRYSEATKENIIDILSNSGSISTKIKEDDIDLMIEFISRIIQIKNTPGKIKQLFDKISTFKNKQIIYNTISKLNKMKDRIDGSPEKIKAVISEANESLSKTDIFATTESIFDSEGYNESEWLTRFNIPEIDNAIGGGFIAPNLVIIQAFTGRGKTWGIAHLAKIAARLGNDCIILETEMANKKFKSRMRMCLTGMTFSEIRNNMNAADSVMRASMVNNAKIHLVSEDVKMGSDYAVDSLEGIVSEIEERTKRKQNLIFIDSPDDLEPPIGQFYNSSIDKSKAIFTWLRNYSQNANKCIIVTCQSQRASENLLWTTSGNIGDDINKVRRATIGISINGYKREVEAGYTRFLIFKNTHGPEMKACWVKNNFERGQWIQETGIIKRLDIVEYKQMLANRGITITGNKSVD